MGKALYRKYRSKSFSEVVGQEHITKTLSLAIKSGRISHAYLFTGPRGVGKTSVARILAHEVNQIPYSGEETHLDIIEIDAASNRRIDEIRDLREKVHIAPTSSKYKVYIIDEVHMLTREAFNALLKTLEEPPAHVIFILATTEAHKLPETIVSRTQRYGFRAVSPELAKGHLASIAKTEKIAIDNEALELLAEFGEGSLRDSISLLDQLSSTNTKIDSELVRLQLGLPPAETMTHLLELTFSGETAKVLDLLTRLRSDGNEASAIARMLSKELRRRLKTEDLPAEGINLLKALSRVSSGSGNMDELEMALLEISTATQSGKPVGPVITTPSVKPETVTQIQPVPKIKSQTLTNFDLTMWSEVLERVKQSNASIYTALHLATPDLSEDTLTLFFEFPLHQKKVNQASAKNTVSSIIEAICGAKILIKCVVDKELVRSLKTVPKQDFYKVKGEPDSLQTISNIFGSAEVLES